MTDSERGSPNSSSSLLHRRIPTFLLEGAGHGRRDPGRRPLLAAYEPSLATVAHRHAVGLVRAEAEAMGLGWDCERELRRVWAAGAATGGGPAPLRRLPRRGVHPSAMTIVTRAAAAVKSASERVMIRPYPPPTLAAVA